MNSESTTRSRVLYCENNVDGTVGGSYYSLLYLLKGLDRSQYEATVVFYTDHALLSAYHDAGIKTLVWSRTSPFSFGSSARGVLRPLLLAAQKATNLLVCFAFPVLVRSWFLISQRIDVVHLNNSVLYNHDWMLAARLTRRRCVTHERGINDVFPRSARYFGRNLDAVICISEAVRRNMQERGADFGNLITVHNGLDPAEMSVRTPADVLRRSCGIPPDAFVIALIGNIKAWKGQETLVRAMDAVRRAHPSARCVLVGDTSPADREYEESLRSLVSELKLEEHVIFAGFQRNVTDFLAMCDVMVHTSVLPEPFGRVILEAMACHKPVIGTRAGAIPEIIAEGKTGLTFPPGNANALADALLQVIRDPNDARRMGEAGFNRLVREFHIARNVEQTQHLYDRLLQSSGTAHRAVASADRQPVRPGPSPVQSVTPSQHDHL